MKGLVWVGKVKSTVAPQLLADAFEKFGSVCKVETGFGGFAFVEFDTEEEADKAVQKLHKATIHGVGEIACDKATHKGYMGALAKRDKYWHGRCQLRPPSSDTTFVPAGRESKSRSASRSVRRRRSSSLSRSLSRRDSARRSPRLRRSPSRTAERRRSPERQRSLSRGGGASRSASRKRSRSGDRRAPSRSNGRDHSEVLDSMAEFLTKGRTKEEEEEKDKSVKDEELRDDEEEEAPQLSMEEIAAIESALETYTEEPDNGQHRSLNSLDRAAVVTFFDGAGLPQLLLEGSATMKLPEFLAPNLMSAFPSGFPQLSQDDALKLLRVLSVGTNGSSVDRPMSFEVRQSITVDAYGQRILQKSLHVNGAVCSTEEQALER